MLFPPTGMTLVCAMPPVGVEQDVGGAAADVDDRDADLFLVVAEDRLGARERLEHHVGHRAGRSAPAQRMTFCTQLVAAVTRLTFTPRRTPLIPMGSRMPSCASTMYSRGITWRIWRSASTGMARAPSRTRSTSARVTSPPAMAATPSDACERMWLPATPAYTVRISTPAIVWALSIASWIEVVVHSMFDTIPLRRPRQGTVPTPRIVIPSSAISATTAHTFVVPISRPTTISPCVLTLLIALVDSHTRGDWAKFASAPAPWRFVPRGEPGDCPSRLLP